MYEDDLGAYFGESTSYYAEIGNSGPVAASARSAPTEAVRPPDPVPATTQRAPRALPPPSPPSPFARSVFPASGRAPAAAEIVFTPDAVLPPSGSSGPVYVPAGTAPATEPAAGSETYPPEPPAAAAPTLSSGWIALGVGVLAFVWLTRPSETEPS